MQILVTGANGFLGRNLTAHLRHHRHVLLLYDLDTPAARLEEYTARAEFVFHLAGLNRPEREADFMAANLGFTETLLAALEKHHNTAPVLFCSSIQAALQNPYGESKKAAEDALLAYAEKTGAEVLIYRLPNLFGKWCRPNYNSVVATFCHNIAHGLPITVDNPKTQLQLAHIDDVTAAFLSALTGDILREGHFCTVEPHYTVSLEALKDLLEGFAAGRDKRIVPDLANPLHHKLYATYQSYLPPEDCAYPLITHIDSRGSFTEFLRSPQAGQISVNISRPGMIKGNHWHHTKSEKFLVLSGEAAVRLCPLHSDELATYRLSGERLRVLDIPPGYVHHIENTGEGDLIVLIWSSACYDPNAPDTYIATI